MPTRAATASGCWSCSSSEGIDPQRVRFAGIVPASEYLHLYQQIDIALDTFPYGGGTTTCDALWMGVPVVSLVGQTAVGRGGLSILSNVGLPELVARSEEEYVRIAVELANDLPRLSQPAFHASPADGAIAADGCPALRPQHRGGLSPDVAAVVCPASTRLAIANTRAGYSPACPN